MRNIDFSKYQYSVNIFDLFIMEHFDDFCLFTGEYEGDTPELDYIRYHINTFNQFVDKHRFDPLKV